MKKRIALVAALLLVIGLLVSCGNPKSLAGTEWNNYLGADAIKTGWRFSFDTNTVKLSAISRGNNNTLIEPITYTYTYADPTVQFLVSGDIVGTGKIDGNKMEVTFAIPTVGGTFKKK